MTKIFVTGVTGYIAGDAIYTITKAHPEYEITCLVRNSDKGAQVAKEYPKIRLVYGDLDATDLIEQESSKADIVLNCADADHEAAIQAIIRGMATRDPSKPAYLIHTSGAALLFHKDIKANTFGEARDEVYDDLKDISEITSMPDEAPHRRTEKLILTAGADHADRIKTAIVCPPAIYGIGRGPDRNRSVQIPDLVKGTLQKGHSFTVNAGKNFCSTVHVRDLSDLYLKLVENAAAGGSLAEWPDKPPIWGPEAYFFAEDGGLVWADVADKVAAEAQKQGFIRKNEVKAISPDEAAGIRPFGQMLWGGNARCGASRARVALKWKPSAPNVDEELKGAVEAEARSLGVKPGHAAVAAGNA